MKRPYKTMISLLYSILVMTFIPVLGISAAFAESENSQSSIAGIEMDGKSTLDIQATLASHITEWQQHDLIIEGETGKVLVPTDVIQFHVQETVKKFEASTTKPWYQFWGSAPVAHLPIDVTVTKDIYEILGKAPFFKDEETIERIVEHAGYLRTTAVTAEETKLTKSALDRVALETAPVNLSYSEVDAVSKELDGTRVLPGEHFSFLQLIEESSIITTEEVSSFIGSILYRAALQTDIAILERHSQNVFVPYADPGLEVRINPLLQKDFAFTNNSDAPILVASSIKNNRLTIELYSFKNNFDITYYTRQQEVKPRTLYRLTPSLRPGAQVVVTEGESGMRVEVYQQKTEVEGVFEDDYRVSRDFYPPVNRVVNVSSLPVITAEGTTGTGVESSNPSEATSNSGNSNTPGTQVIEEPEKEEEWVEVIPPIGKDEKPLPEGYTYDKGGNIVPLLNK